MPTQEKIEAVEDLKQRLDGVKTVLLTEYRGLTVQQLVIEYLNNIGMAKPGHRARFAFKARAIIGVCLHVVEHDFYGDFAVERGMLAEVNFSHSPARNQLADLYFTESFSCPVSH